MAALRVTVIGSLFLLALAGGCANRAPHMVAASGDRAIEQGDFATAEAEYAQVVEAQPWNAKARLQYGKALLANGKTREAREQFEKSYTMDPNNDEVIERLADSMGTLGDVEGAVRFLSVVAEERRTSKDWLRLGRFAQNARDYDTAERAFLSAARGDAGLYARSQLALYNFYNEVGREEKAIERLAMAYWLEPQNKQIEIMIRERGLIPGPTFGIRPIEQSGNAYPTPTNVRTTETSTN